MTRSPVTEAFLREVTSATVPEIEAQPRECIEVSTLKSYVNETRLDDYTDAELIQLTKDSPFLISTRVEHTKILSHDLLAKFVYGEACHDEVSALAYARELGVRVPAVRRVVVLDGEVGDHIIIMERVHGRTLEELWPEMGWWKTLRVAWQLRRYLRTMHRMTSLTAGGLSSGVIQSPWLQALYGPMKHASPVAFTGYLNWWLLNCQPTRYNARPELALTPLPNHIFIHQDLSPRNMIVDFLNQLWVVDWGYAGFYPPYMEYISIEASAMPWLNASSWKARFARLRWKFFRWVAAGPKGPHLKPYKALAEVHRRSCIYRLDRTPYSEEI